MRTTRDMSDRHEARLADRLGGRKTRGSGSSFVDQGDVRRSHGSFFPLVVDGKSTMAKSISFTRDTWDKIVTQAHYGVPGLAFAFFDDERGTITTSLVAVRDDDLAELISEGEAAARMRAEVDRLLADPQLGDRTGRALREVRHAGQVQGL